jgi:tetratricopeptide (TPR) repeat protein
MTLPPLPRTVGRYELGRALGAGGHGVVVEAVLRVDGLEQLVALKLAPDGAVPLDREARIASLLRHPGLVDVLDVGRADGWWFCAMERCDTSVAALGALPPRAVVEVGVAVCAALRYAHDALGLVHLDLKPENLLVRDGRVKVADLGLADARGFGAGRRGGTPGYRAPESSRGPGGPPSDVYALGATLIRLCSGEPPDAVTWDGAGDPPRGEPPAWLAALVYACTDADPAERPTLAAVEAALSALPVSGPGLGDVLRARGLPDGPRPTPPSPVVGRSDERSTLDAWLGDPGAVALTGPPGIGKSSLAKAVAATWSAGPAHVVAVGHAREAVGIVAAAARALGVPLDPRDDPGLTLGRALAARGALLLVLDDADGVGDLGGVATWLHLAPALRVLVTRREHPVGLEGCRTLALGPLLPGPAAEVVRLEAARRGVHLAPEAAAALARRADGVPLVLALAAGRLGVLGADEVLERWGPGLLRAARDDRHATLDDALTPSWEGSTEAERGALAALAVFVDGFDAAAAHEVVGAGAATLLPALTQRSLVRWEDDRGSLLAPVRDFVTARRPSPEAELRHGRHFARFGSPEVVRWRTFYAGGPEWAAFVRDVENLAVAAERAAARRDVEVAVPVALAASMALSRVGQPARAVALTGAVAALEPADPLLRARAWTAHGRLALVAGRVSDGRAALARARAAAREAGDPREQAAVDHAYAALSNEEDVEAVARAAVAGYAAVGLVEERAQALTNLGMLVSYLGAVEEGERLLDESAWVFDRCGCRASAARARANRATLLRRRGRDAEAAVLYREAAEGLRDAGDLISFANATDGLAQVLATEGRWGEAEREFRDAIALTRRFGDARTEAALWNNLGTILEGDAARAAFADALAVAESTGQPRFVLMAACNLCDLCLDAGDPAAAERALARISAAPVDPRLQNLLAACRASLAAARGQAREAQDHLAAVAPVGDDLQVEVIVERAAARVAAAGGAPAEARRRLENARAAARHDRQSLRTVDRTAAALAPLLG